MKDRESYNLRRPLFLWSLGLSLFSFLGFYNCSFTHLRLLVTEGFEASVCGQLMYDGTCGLWMWLFVLSKAPELLDTYFILLRKQKLIFLHWYHHITVFIYCWYHFPKQISMAQWFCTMNYAVHAVMYLYYAVRASGYYRPPKWVNMFITALQLLQMVVGVAVNVFVYQSMSDPSWRCDGKMETTYSYVYCSFAKWKQPIPTSTAPKLLCISAILCSLHISSTAATYENPLPAAQPSYNMSGGTPVNSSNPKGHFTQQI